MKRNTLHLNAFRGEPAISAFDWHFTGLTTAHPEIFQHQWVRTSMTLYRHFALDMARSRSFGSAIADLNALFGLGFPPPPRLNRLGSPTTTTRCLTA